MTDSKKIDCYDFGDDCKSLKYVIIPEGTTAIKSNAFEGCTNLTSVIIPNSVTRIGNRAFEVCSRLTSATIPENATIIGRIAFCGCNQDTISEIYSVSAYLDKSRDREIDYLNTCNFDEAKKFMWRNVQKGFHCSCWDGIMAEEYYAYADDYNENIVSIDEIL